MKKFVYTLAILSLFSVISKAQTPPNAEQLAYDAGVKLGFNDVKGQLAQVGEFRCDWTVTYESGVGYVVNSCGTQSFYWYPGSGNSFFEWYSIYGTSLDYAIATTTDPVMRKRYEGQKVGSNLAYAQAYTSNGGFIQPN